MSDLKPFLAAIAAGKTLTEPEAEQAFSIIMSGAATEAQIGALLMGLRLRGETVPASSTSSARTANPSMEELLKGGRSLVAAMSCASTRLEQPANGNVSVVTG